MEFTAETLKRILFPLEKRRWKGSRALRVALRTVHLLSFSVLFGGHWFGLPQAELVPWLRWTIFSGAGLIAIELWTGFDWIFQLACAFVAVKIVLLLLIPVFWAHRVALMAVVIVIGSVGSHMPGPLRHFCLFPVRVNPAESE